MTTLFHPQLINDSFGDPVLYVTFMFERRGFLFDLGDLQALPARKILRVTDAFISHAHIDHFAGFDRLLRIVLGRDKGLHLFGPPGFIERVGHKLASYTWNLAHKFDNDLTLKVTEAHPEGSSWIAEFRLKERFQCRPLGTVRITDGVLLREEGFRVRTACLDHGIPCLAFALEESRHVNVWKAAVEDAGFRVGPWLRDLRRAVLRDEPDDSAFRIWWQENGVQRECYRPLGELKSKLLRIVPGQKFGYVVDAAYHEANAQTIIELVRDADILFIEAGFLEEDAAIAADKRHLTAAQAGRLAKRAGVKRLQPFHFSSRYSGQAERLLKEAKATFFGSPTTVPKP